MVKVNRTSWHWRLAQMWDQKECTNICQYGRRLVWCGIIIPVVLAFLACLGLFLLSVPIWGWFYMHWGDGLYVPTFFSLFLWGIVGAVAYNESGDIPFGQQVLWRSRIKYWKGWEPLGELWEIICEWVSAAHDKVCPLLEVKRED